MHASPSIARLSAVLAAICGADAMRPPTRFRARAASIARRDALSVAILAVPGAARAFENSLPLPATKSAPLPRKPGPAPKDIGLQKATGALRPCLDTKPHCFSTASIAAFDEALLDEYVGDVGLMAPWTFEKSRADAMRDVVAAIGAYPPGQAGIDGGGWRVVKQAPDYVYVQFESLVKGFVDDVEFAVVADGRLELRTSSRIGRQDKLVNAKRVNYFAAALADAGGWKTAPVTAATHPVYFEENTTSQTRGDDLKRLRGSVDGEGNSF